MRRSMLILNVDDDEDDREMFKDAVHPRSYPDLSWVVGFIGYGASGFIHVLLVLAFFVLVLRGIRDARNLN